MTWRIILFLLLISSINTYSQDSLYHVLNNNFRIFEESDYSDTVSMNIIIDRAMFRLRNDESDTIALKYLHITYYNRGIVLLNLSISEKEPHQAEFYSLEAVKAFAASREYWIQFAPRH